MHENCSQPAVHVSASLQFITVNDYEIPHTQLQHLICWQVEFFCVLLILLRAHAHHKSGGGRSHSEKHYMSFLWHQLILLHIVQLAAHISAIRSPLLTGLVYTADSRSIEGEPYILTTLCEAQMCFPSGMTAFLSMQMMPSLIT